MKYLTAVWCRAKDDEPEPPYDRQPIVYFPVTCSFCRGDGCIMCEEQPSIHAARLTDMTIKQRPGGGAA